MEEMRERGTGGGKGLKEIETMTVTRKSEPTGPGRIDGGVTHDGE